VKRIKQQVKDLWKYNAMHGKYPKSLEKADVDRTTQTPGSKLWHQALN